ncbi:MAG TPA: hypothetical protein PL088_11815 [Spirochaetota bacterium]|nr:hypothetical protein [Spirochaetota bacterium]
MKIESLASTVIHYSVLENPELFKYINEHKGEMAALGSLFYNFDTLAVVYSAAIEPYGKPREYFEKRLHDYQHAFQDALDVQTHDGERFTCDIEDVLIFIRRYMRLIEDLTPDATGIDPRLLTAEEEIRRYARHINELQKIMQSIPEAPVGVDECAQPPAVLRWLKGDDVFARHINQLFEKGVTDTTCADVRSGKKINFISASPYVDAICLYHTWEKMRHISGINHPWRRIADTATQNLSPFDIDQLRKIASDMKRAGKFGEDPEDTEHERIKFFREILK